MRYLTAATKDAIAYIALFGWGIVSWLGIMGLADVGEAWDSPEYFEYVWPSLMVIAGVFGFALPKHWWHWAVTPIAAQFIVGLWLADGHINLWPLSIVAFCILALPCLAAAWLGAWVRRKIARV